MYSNVSIGHWINKAKKTWDTKPRFFDLKCFQHIWSVVPCKVTFTVRFLDLGLEDLRSQILSIPPSVVWVIWSWLHLFLSTWDRYSRTCFMVTNIYWFFYILIAYHHIKISRKSFKGLWFKLRLQNFKSIFEFVTNVSKITDFYPRLFPRIHPRIQFLIFDRILPL